MAIAAGMLAVAVHRGGDWTLKLSRTVAFRGLLAGVVGAYLAAMALATGMFASVGGAHARVVQTAFVAGATATLFGILASPWLRAWVKVKVAKHLFDHRYDYRHEWLRFTATLGPARRRSRAARTARGQGDRRPDRFARRTAAGRGRATRWSRPAAGIGWGRGRVGAVLVEQLDNDRILDLDELRAAPDAGLPRWLAERPDAWAVVPLIHLGQLAGAVVLARPPIDRALDWEDFDLLRVAGRQGASYLAEERAAAALGRSQALRGIQPPLRLHHPRREESREPIDPGRAQCRTPRRQSRLPRRHDRHAAGQLRPDVCAASAPVAAQRHPRRSAARPPTLARSSPGSRASAAASIRSS